MFRVIPLIILGINIPLAYNKTGLGFPSTQNSSFAEICKAMVLNLWLATQS